MEEGDSVGSAEPAHHVRRPINAFLIFCKRHRPLVRQRFPHLENRSVTKVLGEWWTFLEPPEKDKFTELAKEYKDVFMTANPGFKWYKLPAPTQQRSHATRTANPRPLQPPLPDSAMSITPGKLADESQLGGLSSLLTPKTSLSPPSPLPAPLAIAAPPSVPKPRNKRYLEENYFDEIQSCGPSSSGSVNASAIVKNSVIRSRAPHTRKDITPTAKLSENEQRMKVWRKKILKTSHQDIINKVVEGCLEADSDKKLRSSVEACNNNIYETISLEQVKTMTFCPSQQCSTVSGRGKMVVKNKVLKSDCSNKIVSKHSCVLNTNAVKVETTATLSEQSSVDGLIPAICINKSGPKKAETSSGKSARACKGLRYRELMFTGQIVTPQSRLRISPNAKTPKVGQRQVSTKTTEYGNTVVRAKRKVLLTEENAPKKMTTRSAIERVTEQNLASCEKPEGFEQKGVKKKQHNTTGTCDFNLERKIQALPTHSFDEFQLKKRLRKKPSLQTSPGTCCSNNKQIKEASAEFGSDKILKEKQAEPQMKEPNKTEAELLVGSRKRKARKCQITHLQPGTKIKDTSVIEENVLQTLGLATLAAVAAIKNQQDDQ